MHRYFFFLSLVLLGLSTGCRKPVENGRTAGASQSIRIVSLAPNITEAVCAVGAGDLLVGRTSACDYPSWIVEKVPVIGNFGAPSLEMLAKMNPTLVLVSDLADETMGKKMDSLGIRCRRLATHKLSDIPKLLREVGRLTGHAKNGNRLADEMEKRMAELKKQAELCKHPRVYAEIWGDPMTTAGAGTVLSDLIALAGGVNIGDASHNDYFQISPETVVRAAPDVILCLYMNESKGVAEMLKKRPGWGAIPAVKNNAVFDELNNDVLLRPGPRALDGVAILKQCFKKAGF